MPEYHIVPSSVVANTLKEDHGRWLVLPENGQQHNDNYIRYLEI